MANSPSQSNRSTVVRPVRGLEEERILARVREGLIGEPAQSVQMGRYTVLDQIGSGGLGVVYSAYDPELQRKIAIKLLRLDRTFGETGKELEVRVHREAQAMARLSHPNVVEVYDVGVFEQRVFIAMAFVAGGSLREWLAREPRTWREAVDVFSRAGRGLAAAHEAGLVHRDFKPDNVLVGDDGRVRVADFGLARAIETADDATDQPPVAADAPRSGRDSTPLGARLTTAGRVMGTPRYMAPEQHRGQPPSPRTDQYAFCVALFEALYDEPAFKGDTFESLLESKLHPTLKLERPTPVPQGLHTAIARGLAVDPDERWPSMAALLAELERSASRRHHRVLIAGVGLGMAVGLLAVSTPRSPCDDVGDALDGVWDPEHRQQLRQAFEATELPFASYVHGRAERRLDEFADDWLAIRLDVCEAPPQDGDVLDLKMACLSQSRSELGAVLEVLMSGSSAVVERSPEVVGVLPRLERCTDIQALRTEVAPPRDPTVATRVEALRARLAEARAVGRSERLADALVISSQVAGQARQLGYDPLLAHALSLHGTLQARSGANRSALEPLEEAYYLATAVGDDDHAAEAATSLAGAFVRLVRFDEAERWARHASAVVARLRRPALRDATLLAVAAVMFQRQGRFPAARELAERSREQFERARGPTDSSVALMLNLLGAIAGEQGHHDESVAYFERSLALAETAGGPNHPTVGMVLANLGGAAWKGGAYERALRYHERALTVLEAGYGPNHPRTAIAVQGLGTDHGSLGNREQARAYELRALQIYEQGVGPAHPFTAMAINNFAASLVLDGEPERAFRLRLRANAIFERAHRGSHPNVALTLEGLGNDARRLGRSADSLVYYRRALRIRERLQGSDHARTGMLLGNLGQALTDSGRAREALPLVERSLAILERQTVPPEDMAAVSLILARTLWDAGGSRTRAQHLARAARDRLPDSSASLPAREAIDAWLDASPSRRTGR